MDFQSLSRKELQTLCKINKIHANMTNVAMADALSALHQIEGLEEFLNPIESQLHEQRIENGSPVNPQTACRTSTRRKPDKEEPPTTQSITRTRRGKVGGMSDHENNDLNIPPTPSFPSNRRKTQVPSARRNLKNQSIEEKNEEAEQKNEDRERSDVLETPSVSKTERKVPGGSTRRKTEVRTEKSLGQGVCSTRRSMRLLEKNLEKMSLMECESLGPAVAYKLFDEIPERKGFPEQKTNEPDSEELNMAVEKKNGSDDAFEEEEEEEESDDAKGENEKKDEKVNYNGKDCEEFEVDDKPKEKLEMVDEQDNVNNMQSEDQKELLTMEKHNENSVAQSPLTQEEVIDVNLTVSQLMENSNQETCNYEKQVNDFSTMDSISEAKMEDEKSLVDEHEIQEQVNSFSAMDSILEPKMEDLSKSEKKLVDEIQLLPDEDNSGLMIHNSSRFTALAVDELPRPTTVVSMEESRTSLEMFKSRNEECIKNSCSEEEEKNSVSLRQLRKMIKQLHLSKQTNKETINSKEKVEKVVRNALQPLAENCMGQERTTSANSIFFQ